MTLPDRFSTSRGAPLSDDEQRVRHALGADEVPAPRRSQAAFVASVRGELEANHHRSHRWALVSAPLAAAAAFGIVLGMPEPAPPAASGADLYALTLDAFDDDEGWSDDGFVAILEDDSALDDDAFDDDDDEGDRMESGGIESGGMESGGMESGGDATGPTEVLELADAPLTAAVTAFSDADLLDAFDDDALSAFDALLDESLAD